MAAYQVGGCGTACDPFASLENSGCVDSCGGPAARCNWIVGDPVGDSPRGYCGAAVRVPLTAGEKCARGAVDPCEAGARCLIVSDGTTRTCTKLCDPESAPGEPDACLGQDKCVGFGGLLRSGYCKKS